MTVKFKDKRAKLWCEDVERVTDDKLIYVRVYEEDFYKYYFDNFGKMIQFFNHEDDKDGLHIGHQMIS